MLTCVIQARGIPTVSFAKTHGQLHLNEIKNIVVDSQYAELVNTHGETLIPPSLRDFAETFAQDLKGLGVNISTQVGGSASNASIFLTLGDPSDYLDVAGRESAEGYSLSVSSSGIGITGASPLGAWWGTRTVLQQVSPPIYHNTKQFTNSSGSLGKRVYPVRFR